MVTQPHNRASQALCATAIGQIKLKCGLVLRCMLAGITAIDAMDMPQLGMYLSMSGIPTSLFHRRQNGLESVSQWFGVVKQATNEEAPLFICS